VKEKLIFLVILIILLLICYVFFANLNNSSPLSQKEKETALTKLFGRSLNFNPKEKGDVQFRGKYMTFTYPGSSLIYTYRQPGFKNDKATLEYFSFDMQDPRLIFNYSVIQTINLKNVSDYPSVRIRQIDPAFEKSDFVLDGKKGIHLTKKDNGAEESVFILDNTKLYTIIVVGQNYSATDGLFQKIIKSSKFL